VDCAGREQSLEPHVSYASASASPLFRRKRVPVLTQATLHECGAACIAMIANYWGRRVDLEHFRSRMPENSLGSRIKDLVSMAATVGLHGTIRRVATIEELQREQHPVVLHLREGHFVVFVRVSSGKAIVHDPAKGRTVLKASLVEKAMSGVIISFEPQHAFEGTAESQQFTLRSALSGLVGIGSPVAQIVSLSFLMQLATLAAPLYIQLVVDQSIARNDSDLLTVLLVGFMMISLVLTVAFFLRRVVTLKLGVAISTSLTGSVFAHMLRLRPGFFEARALGDITSRFGSTTAIKNFLTGPVLDACVDSVTATLALIALVALSPTAALLVVGAVLLEGIIHFSTVALRQRLLQTQLVDEAAEETLFVESVKAMRTIKLSNRENEILARWKSRFGHASESGYQYSFTDSAIKSSTDVVESLGATLIVFLLARSVLGNALTVGEMMSFIAYQMFFGKCAKNAVDTWVNWKTLQVHLGRLSDIMRAPPEQQQTGTRKRLSGGFELRNIVYAYPGDGKNTLNSISFSAAPGTLIAITGPSGEGKTTLLKVLIGLLEQRSGEVLYDGLPLATLHRPTFLEQVAVVMQDDTLLSGTIKDNVCFFDPMPSDEQIVAVCKLACIHADIMSMPLGYNTIIGDMGNLLSGGQKQRLFIARALYRNPKILFLDEGTSQLDLALERELNDNLARLKMTRVIVAHRPDTFRVADRVLLLSNGELREMEPPELTSEKHPQPQASPA
jgi:ATP-binding cassette, subfamily B, bacterial CvaB/MchF/RaxB